MREFLVLLERHQLRTQKAGWMPPSDEEIQQECVSRKRFCHALEDPAISDEDVAKLGSGTGAEGLYQPPDAAAIAELRRNLGACPIMFTQAEPPALATILSQSFWRLRHVAEQGCANAKFILASDYTYRPHASIQEMRPELYLILIGRYLLADITSIAHILADLMANTRETDDELPWQKSTFPIKLPEEYDRSPLRWQLPYKLCSSAEGERYRFAIRFQGSDDFAQVIATELITGATDFLIGHELGHIIRGHLRDRATLPNGIPWIYQEAFKFLREMLGGDTEELIAQFTNRCLPHLARELDADALGLLWSAGFGPTGAWDLRLMGAQLAISTIAFVDRAIYMIKNGRDPGMLIGLDNYSMPGVVDILLPKTSHPWGKTRATFLCNSLSALYQQDFPPAELKRKAALMLVVQDVFNIHGAFALQAVHFVNSKPGEYVAMLLPDDKLWTRYFPPTATADGGHEDTITEASQFYLDLSGQRLIHDPNKVKWLVKIRQEQQYGTPQDKSQDDKGLDV